MEIATLNLRDTADRWPACGRPMVEQLVELAPDVLRGADPTPTASDHYGLTATVREGRAQGESR